MACREPGGCRSAGPAHARDGRDGRAAPDTRHARPPPVAILTAVPTGENTIEAMRLGAVDHLAKPIGRDGLRALMERLVSVPADIHLSRTRGDNAGG